MDSRQLAEILLTQRGLGSAKKRLRVTIIKRVCAALRHFRVRGLVMSENGEDGLLAWRLG